METLVDRVTTAFREQVWRSIRLPNAEGSRRSQAERIWWRLLRRGREVVARDPELYLYLALTAERQSPKRDLLGFLRERAQRRLGRPALSATTRPPSVVEDATRAEALARLSRLPARARMVLIAHRRERMSFEAIGRRMDCSAEHAQRLFVYALKTCVLSERDRL